jgi:hypothetical protein
VSVPAELQRTDRLSAATTDKLSEILAGMVHRVRLSSVYNKASFVLASLGLRRTDARRKKNGNNRYH